MKHMHGAGMVSAIGSLILFVRKMQEPTTEMYLIQTARWLVQLGGGRAKKGENSRSCFWSMVERKATMRRKDWKLLVKASRQIDIVIARSIFIEQIYVCLKMFGKNNLISENDQQESAQ